MIWLHGVSVGESLANLTLAKAILEQYPTQRVLLTSTTKTSKSLLTKATHERLFYDTYPIDLPWKVNAFLDKWQPQFAIFGESELWPVMLGALRKRHIPAALINARLSERSYKRWKLLGFMIKPMLETFSIILGQSDEESARYVGLGAENVFTSGNLKFAAEPLSYDKKGLSALKQATTDRPILLFASTHDPEEQIALQIHETLKKKYPKLLTIIIPRHPERGSKIREMISAPCAQRSKNETLGDETEVYLADTLGELGLFYKLCPIAFIGNSLSEKPGGGHNPIEPAHLDCAIVYGPIMHNFKLIDAEMTQKDAVMKAGSIEETIESLDTLLNDPDKQKNLIKNAKTYAQSKQDVLPDILEKLTPLIDTALHESA